MADAQAEPREDRLKEITKRWNMGDYALENGRTAADVCDLLDHIDRLTRDLEAAQKALETERSVSRTIATAHKADAQELLQRRAELEAVRQEVNTLKDINLAVEDDLTAARARLAAAERVAEVVKKHYPSIAGRVIRLYDAGEDRAGMEWAEVAKDFHTALSAFDAATVGQEQP